MTSDPAGHQFAELFVTGSARAASLCSYCHASFAGDEPTWTCGHCKVKLHSDCRTEAGHCPTPGCVASIWSITRAIAALDALAAVDGDDVSQSQVEQ